jgi:hypothetical protein
VKRRLARLQASGQFLVDALKGTGRRRFHVKQNALPADAELDWMYTGDDHCLWVVIESASFAEVEEGAVIPELPLPICETVRTA